MEIIIDSQKSNRAIAKFMGISVYPEKDTPEYKKWKGQRCDYDEFELKYHNSWDWLMPVLNRIEDLGYDVYIKGERYYNDDTDSVDFNKLQRVCHITYRYSVIVNEMAEDRQSRIEAVYKAVVGFINYYNAKTK